MAEVRLSDVVIPEVFTEYIQVRTAELSEFRNSGVLVDSPRINELLSGGANTFNVPFFNDLAQDDPNVSSDDPASFSVAKKISTGQEIAQRHNLNQSWSSMDLVDPLSGTDPVGVITSLVGGYWGRAENRMIVAACEGIFADNEANDSGDMLNDIALGSAGTPTSVNLISAEAVIDAQQTMGDAQGALGVLAVHSVVMARMKKNNLIDFVPDSQGLVDIPFFLGLRVVVEDSLPTNTVNGNVEYSSYLFGTGAFLRGESPARVPTAVDRDEKAGDGGGQEFLHSRVQWAHHARGFAWIAGSQAGTSPTFAELRLAANWDRRYPERKQIKLAELRSNG